VTKRKPDALAKLLEHCDSLSIRTRTLVSEQAKTRRLIRALLVERAQQARSCVYDYESETGIIFDANVRAAVLRRPR
jgi:hypothetical protein